MNVELRERQRLLVLEDIDETASLIEKMLNRNGYCVTLAKSEEDAIWRARSRPPDLILMSLGCEPDQLLATANRIREDAGISQDVAIVIFCVETIPEGAVMEVGTKIYVTRPDNFNQLRELLHRLLWNGMDC
jgi:DNA-binding response OmpR family regulator